MRTRTTTILVAGVPGMPSFSSRATLRSRMIQVLIAIQPVAITIWKKAGKYAPRLPNALRARTICVTPVLWPIKTNAPKITTPMALPRVRTSTVSQNPRPSTIPSAPNTQLIGAMLAPAQIQNWSSGVASLYSSGTGAMLLCFSMCMASSSSALSPRSSTPGCLLTATPLPYRSLVLARCLSVSSLEIHDLAHEPALRRTGLRNDLAVLDDQRRRRQAPYGVPPVRGVNQHQVGRVPLGYAIVF